MQLLYYVVILFGLRNAFCSDNKNLVSEAMINLAKSLTGEHRSSFQIRKKPESNVIFRKQKFDFLLKTMIDSKNRPSFLMKTTSTNEEPQPRVQTENGLVIGETNADSHAFYSVPYAKPPLGPRRYLPPEPADHHSDLDVSIPDYRCCWQVLPCEPNCQPRDGNLTEDCLLINIDVPKTVNLYDPNNPPDERLPVLFWIHGGFFLFGSGTSYRTAAKVLSRDAQVIVVQVNYRLGPFGFLAFQDGDTFNEGNQGLKDQQMALQWVQKNIEKFGGDKKRVTLFGNSAGAQSINFHLLSSVSKPHFRRAILQSSPSVLSYPTPQEFNKTITRRFLIALNCTEGTSCLRTLKPEALVAVRGEMLINSLNEKDLFGAIEPFRPVIDGIEFRAQPLTLFKNGMWQTDKELIIGTAQEEMAYIEALFEKANINLTCRLFKRINTAIFGKQNGEIINDFYSPGACPRVDNDYSDEFSKEVTDFFFVCPNRALARFAADSSTAKHKNVYLYNLAYPLSDESCNAITDLNTVCGFAFHSSEPILLFKSDHSYGISFTQKDRLVSNMMTSYWGRFAYSGDPSFGNDVYAENFTSWPIYRNETENPWKNIVLDYNQSFVVQDYKMAICDMWDATNFYLKEENISTITTTTSSSTITATSLADERTTQNVGEQETTTGGATYLKKNGLILLLSIVLTSFVYSANCN